MPASLFSRLRWGPLGLVGVAGVILVIFAIRNLPWHLDDYDQAKQAYVSFEMVNEGHWWLQHTPSGKIATKPPLVGWVSAGLWALSGGHWPLAWRLPGIAAAAVLLWMLGRAGWRISGWEGATLGVAALGLNLVAPRLATLVRTDMVLALFIALAGFAIYEKLRTGATWTTADRWKMFAILLGSMLTKGPIVYAFLLPGLAAFWWLQRKRATSAQAWSGWWSWLGPLLFFGLWAGIGIATDREFYEQVVQREFLGRFTIGERAVHHNQPVYFYLLHIVRDFFPWSVVLLALGCAREVREKVRRDPALLWLVCWAIGGLVVMSLVPSKRGDRIFPVYPPLCLLVPALAALLPVQWAPRFTPALRALAVIAVATCTAGGYAAYRWAESRRFHDDALTAFCARVRPLAPPNRLAVVSGRDEGMLLYLGLLHFTEWKEARELWQKGALEVVVAPVRFQEEAEQALPGSVVAFISERRGRPLEDDQPEGSEKLARYICLTRRSE